MRGNKPYKIIRFLDETSPVAQLEKEVGFSWGFFLPLCSVLCDKKNKTFLNNIFKKLKKMRLNDTEIKNLN